ncbi:hypothetical protein [Burkholderia ubonensis]|nr:hypothetical protein [Burkholderia ubonensis]
MTLTVVDMRPRAQPLNPDNPEQVEAAAAWNALAAPELSLANTGY